MAITVIDELINARNEQGISNKEIAESSGVSEANVSRIFSGKNENPGILTLLDIAGALGVEIGVMKAAAKESASTAETALYRRMLSDRDKTIVEKNKWIRNLAITLAVVAGAFIVWLLVDVTNGNIGFVRY